MQFLIVIKRITAVIFISLYLFSCNTIEPPPPPKYQSIDESPAWSPDGKWIAYYHFNSNPDDSLYPTGLYIIDTSGSNRRLIIAGRAYNPDWSPDGSLLAFDVGRIFITNVYTGELKQLTFGSGQHFPQWSPDGKYIAFEDVINTPPDTAGIWIINVNTLEMRYFDRGGTPDWSPDNTSLVYKSLEGITIGKIDGTSFKTILPIKKETGCPRWSPDGTTIAYIRDKPIWATIWLMDTEGGNQRELVSNCYSSPPSWAPDSRKIAFQNLNPEKNKIVIWIINIDGSGLKQITY